MASRNQRRKEARSFDDGPAPAEQFVALDVICEGGNGAAHASHRVCRFRAWTHDGSPFPSASTVSVAGPYDRLPNAWANPEDWTRNGRLDIDIDCTVCGAARSVPHDWIVATLARLWAPKAQHIERFVIN